MKNFNPLQALRISGPLFTALAMLTGCAATDEPTDGSVVTVDDQGVSQQWDTSECWEDSEQCQLAADCAEGGGTWQDGQCVVEVPIDWEQDCENDGGEWDATNEECTYPDEEAAACAEAGGTMAEDGECVPELEACASEDCEDSGGKRYYRSKHEAHEVVEVQYRLNANHQETLDYLCENAEVDAKEKCDASGTWPWTARSTGGFAHRRDCSAGGDFQTCTCIWQVTCEYSLW